MCIRDRSNEYQFRILVTPVGPYFKGGAKPITICVSDFDRAAPVSYTHLDYTCFNLYFAVDITLTLSMVALLPFTLREVGK